ncbi:LpqB family beta-propeller domain-containing protein [Pseudonocardia sp.]|uniref:LpqB family beta-propeller domain-containing protein n=1 Tax=Pseudonocardia sp. TaxID=60912 RepID=UPI003D1439A0
MALCLLAALAGCASVPDSSPVQVLKRVTEGEAPPAPPGPVDGADPSEIVRGFVTASGSSSDNHGAARRFLAPEIATTWDDGGDLTVLDGQLDTVPAPGAPMPSSGRTTIRIRGTAIGHVTPTGAFEPDETPVEIDVELVRRAGQWRISALPDGVVVPLAVFTESYRAVKVYFVDPVHHKAVPDLRYLPAVPSRAQSARLLELLLAGPSSALRGAVASQFGPEARLRSNVAASPDGALVVDLTGIGQLDETGRRLLAAQVVLSLTEVNVDRVRLLLDGEPLLPGGDLTPTTIAAYDGEKRPAVDVPGLVVAGGRVRQLTGSEPGAVLPGQVGNGAVDVLSAATTGDGQHLAVVVREGARQRLLLGGGSDGDVVPVALTGSVLSRPSWTPDGTEVWTVVDSTDLRRVLLPALDAPPGTPARITSVDMSGLTGRGPVTELRLSRDGMRVLAVAGGGIYTAAVARGVDGDVTLRNVRRLRSGSLAEAVGADWRSADSLVVITAAPAGPVVQVSVDGLTMLGVPGTNLTPPLRAVAAGPSRPLVVADAGGVWSFTGGDQVAWRAVLGGVPDAVPLYPG